MKTQPVIEAPVVRLLEFVEEQGGITEVSRKIGKPQQIFYNMRDGKSKFSIETLRIIQGAYPGQLDANYILFGFKGENLEKYGGDPVAEAASAAIKPAAPPVPVTIDVQKAIELAKLQVENEQLKEKLEMLKDLVEDLKAEKNALYAQLFFDPTDPNSASLGRKRPYGAHVGKAWVSSIATDLLEEEMPQPEERKPIGYEYSKSEQPKRVSSLVVIKGGNASYFNQTELLTATA